MDRLVLGIWGYSADSPAVTHDSGAALLREGTVVAAVNEERFTRKKIEGCFPIRSIEAVLDIAGIGPGEVDAVALAGLGPFARSYKMLKYIMKTYRETGAFLWYRTLYALLTAKKIRRTVPAPFSDKKVSCVDHHEAHAAAAYFTSPWPEATVITLDGIGDSSICGTVSIARDGELKKLWECNGYYSPGLFYTAITLRFGFSPSKHEGKITGLAAYGDPDKTIAEIRKIIRYDRKRHDFASHHIPNLFRANDYAGWRIPLIDELLDQYTWEHVAAGVQMRTEEVVCELVEDAVSHTGVANVALNGGVFSNVKVNQRIRELDCVDAVYVHPNMGDGGLAMGAAYAVCAKRALRAGERLLPRFLPTVYLGPSYGSARIESALKKSGLAYERQADIEGQVAELLRQGRIVGRFNGRMEYGPRALGNRSILAQATDKRINDWLNKRLKRTEFMPFAPSILEEDASGFFIDWSSGHTPARFMAMTYDMPQEMAKRVPAVSHVDLTARPQVVREKDNPSYYRIIELYKELTGLPVIVNTSFNMHEEPIVCTPEDALRSFANGSVDVLAIGDFMVSAS